MHPYYMADTREMMEAYEAIAGPLVMRVDGVDRRPVTWEDWAITTWIDTADYWRTVLRAILCHKSQISADMQKGLERQCQVLFSRQTYIRAFSMVNGGRRPERDLFEGLR